MRGERTYRRSHGRSDLRPAFRRPRLLGRRRPAPHPLRRLGRVHPRDHRPRRRELSVHRGRPPDPRLHLRPDERDPGPLSPGDRGHRHAAGGQARPPVQRHAQPSRRGPGPPSGRDTAGTAGEGAAADDRRRVERGRHPDGQARHRQTRDRLVRPVLARHDPGRRERHLQRGQKGLRSGRARQLRHPRPQPLPSRLHHRGRRIRLAASAGLRFRPDRRTVGRQPGRGHRRADPQLRRHHRAAARVLRRVAGQVRRTRHAADPG